MLLVLDLRLGQRGAVGDAPVDGPLLSIEQILRGDLAELANLLRLVVEAQRLVRMVPLAEHAHALELGALHVDELERVLAALLEELVFRERALVDLLLAQPLLDVLLDGQTVAVPPGHVVGEVAARVLVLDDDVLEHLVERVAGVQVAVRVRRAVVQHVGRPTLVLLEDFLELPLGFHRSSSLGSSTARFPFMGNSVCGRLRVAL